MKRRIMVDLVLYTGTRQVASDRTVGVVPVLNFTAATRASMRTTLTLALLATLVAAAPAAAQRAERVLVQKVQDSHVIVQRGNGDVYRLEYGTGCLSLWRQEGRQVVVSYSTLFDGVGSKIVIAEHSQECRIWEARLLASGRGAAAPAAAAGPATAGGVAAARQAADIFSLFDSRGEAVAWLDIEEGLTFYLWTGRPVAYLVDGRHIYGFNGKHLGFYHDASVYDHRGRVVAAPAAAFATPTRPPPPRSFQQLKPLQSLQRLPPLEPLFGRTWSDTPAVVFFADGRS